MGRARYAEARSPASQRTVGRLANQQLISVTLNKRRDPLAQQRMIVNGKDMIFSWLRHELVPLDRFVWVLPNTG
jgi:hypothetical protein